MNAGPLAMRLGLAGSPRVAEEVIIQRDILLSRHENFAARYHVQHLSTGGSVEMVRQARADLFGQAQITAEVSPHHLLLTEDSCLVHKRLVFSGRVKRRGHERQLQRAVERRLPQGERICP